MAAQSQGLDSPMLAAQPVEQPVKPTAGRCDVTGCIADLSDPDRHCVYCGEKAEA